MKKTLLICAIVLALCGCRSRETEEPETSYLTLVTYAGTDEELQVSTFTYQAIDDSPLITLTANWIPSTEMTPGERIYIDYYAEAYGQSGPVRLRRVSPVIGWTPAEADGPIALGNVDVAPVTVWRSGPYFNARIDAMLTADPVSVKFVLDRSTLGEPMPVYYLSLDQPNAHKVEAYRRTATISFDISPVWNASTSQGIKVVYRGQNGTESALELTKKD